MERQWKMAREPENADVPFFAYHWWVLKLVVENRWRNLWLGCRDRWRRWNTPWLLNDEDDDYDNSAWEAFVERNKDVTQEEIDAFAAEIMAR